MLHWLSGENAPPFLVKQAIREELEALRQDILAGKKVGKRDLSKKKLLEKILGRLQAKTGPNFKRVINATGVVIHTNLGRSILPESASKAS